MTKFCKACLAKHDEETHAATNRVHEWFRARVTKHLHDVADESRMEHPLGLTPSQGDALQPTHFNAA